MWRPRKLLGTVISRTIALSAVGLALLVFSAISAFSQQATVKRNSNLRKSPTTASAIVEKLTAGSQVTLTSNRKRSGYYRVRAQDDAVGWALARNISVGGESPTPTPESPTPAPNPNGGKITVPCPTQAVLNAQGINACPDTGCGLLDPLLNKQKNIRVGDPDTAKDIAFADLAALKDQVQGFQGIGFPRDALQHPNGSSLGEGQMVRLVAWALDARPQNTQDLNKKGESCNCGFTGVNDPQDTDVHIVLVDDPTLNLTAPAGGGKTAVFNTLKKREAVSQTAEYTPRVRVSRNEAFDGAKLKSLIDPMNGGVLHVRVTGLIMFDSEHAVEHPLLRHTNWEIHPVFRLEFCPKNKTCSSGSNLNWVDTNK